jgi:hypothetical protein
VGTNILVGNQRRKPTVVGSFLFGRIQPRSLAEFSKFLGSPVIYQDFAVTPFSFLINFISIQIIAYHMGKAFFFPWWVWGGVWREKAPQTPPPGSIARDLEGILPPKNKETHNFVII